MTVLFAADRADFDFEHGVRLLRLVEQFLGDVQISLSGTVEPSHICDWNVGSWPRAT